MGKVRTRILGLEDVEREQKKKQKTRSAEKKGAEGEGNKVKGVEEQKASKQKIEGVSILKTEEKESKATVPAEAPAIEHKEKKQEVKKSPPKQTKTTKSRVRGKKYKTARANLDQNKSYSLDEAIGILKKAAYAQFEESFELHLGLTKAGIKGEVVFPNPTGKSIRVKIVDDNLLGQIEDGKIEFDMLVAHPSYMPKLAKYAKILGPRGLMPSPKAGTVTPKPEDVVKKYTGGTTAWRAEQKAPLLHIMIGKASLDDPKLVKNAQALIDSVGKQNITGIFITTTMGPSLRVHTD